MAIEESPIYELLVRDMGSPVQLPPVDCSWAALVELAGIPAARVAVPMALAPAPAKPAESKPMKQVQKTAS